jgi:hypothetical protein
MCNIPCNSRSTASCCCCRMRTVLLHQKVSQVGNSHDTLACSSTPHAKQVLWQPPRLAWQETRSTMHRTLVDTAVHMSQTRPPVIACPTALQRVIPMVVSICRQRKLSLLNYSCQQLLKHPYPHAKYGPYEADPNIPRRATVLKDQSNLLHTVAVCITPGVHP